MRNPAQNSNSPAGAVRPLTGQEFARISQLAYDQFGLELKPGKEELVSARLGKKVRAAGCRSFQEYYRHVLEDTTGEALIELIDALTTNFTGFMREPVHFEFLRKHILPQWLGRDSIRIWSAACSTGEEPYTIAFSLLDALAGTVPGGGKSLGFGNGSRPSVRILATDISSRALGEARRGTYPAGRLEHLPAAWQHAFLLRGEARWEGWFRVKPEVSRLIEFQRLNLIEPFSHAQPFAAIFCRNVMIYFDKQTQQNLIERLAGQLEPGGYLLIGHSESLTGIEHSLTYIRPTVYRKGPK